MPGVVTLWSEFQLLTHGLLDEHGVFFTVYCRTHPHIAPGTTIYHTVHDTLTFHTSISNEWNAYWARQIDCTTV